MHLRETFVLLFRNHLFWLILIAGLVPHSCASVMQIFNNNTRIDPDAEFFAKALIAYNIVVHPGCIGWRSRNLFRFASGYRRIIARQEIPRATPRKLKGEILRLPRQFAFLTAFGWFPGSHLFPCLLDNF